MERYIPVDKLSKKQRKAYYAAKRGSWNGVNPVSRAVPSKKVYNRKQAKHWREEDALSVSFLDIKNALCGLRVRTTQRIIIILGVISPSWQRLRRTP